MKVITNSKKKKLGKMDRLGFYEDVVSKFTSDSFNY